MEEMISLIGSSSSTTRMRSVVMDKRTLILNRQQLAVPHSFCDPRRGSELGLMLVRATYKDRLGAAFSAVCELVPAGLKSDLDISLLRALIFTRYKKVFIVAGEAYT